MYTVLGICAGNGTVLYPFKDKLIGNIEIRSVFKTPNDQQWKKNFGDIPLYKNIPPKCQHKGIHNSTCISPIAPVDVIIAHPDCGNSSVLAYSRGKKLSDPKQNESLILFINCLSIFRPKVFLMENLPALLTNYGEEAWVRLFSEYRFKFFQGPVTLWGNSQKSRKRLVMIGIRKDINIPWKYFRLPESEDIQLKTTGSLIRDLKDYTDPELCHVRLPLKTRIAIFGGKQMTLREIRDSWKQRFWEKRFPTGENKMKNAPGVYRNLNRDYPLTVRKGNREFNQQGLIMTPRERARIQGLPDHFSLIYHPDKSGFWINKGNVTVTKCFPYEISIWFRKCLRKIQNKQLI